MRLHVTEAALFPPLLQKTGAVPWLGQLLESACADVDPRLTTPRFGSQLMHTIMLLHHEVGHSTDPAVQLASPRPGNHDGSQPRHGA